MDDLQKKLAAYQTSLLGIGAIVGSAAVIMATTGGAGAGILAGVLGAAVVETTKNTLGNLFANFLQRKVDDLNQREIDARTLVVNHDLQKALLAALRIAAEKTAAEYARKNPGEGADHQRFARRIAEHCAPEQTAFLMSVPDAELLAFLERSRKLHQWDHADLARLAPFLEEHLAGHRDHFRAFATDVFPAEVELRFWEILKTEDRPWRAWVRWNLDQFSDQLGALAKGQESMRADLGEIRTLFREFASAFHDQAAPDVVARAAPFRALVEAAVSGLEGRLRDVLAEIDRKLGVIQATVETGFEQIGARLEKLEVIAKEFGRASGLATVPAPVRKRRGVNPFKGLHYYDRDDHDIFFGRGQWCGAALEQFERLWREEPCRVWYGIVGESGVGKSSLLRAGLLPALCQGEGNRRGYGAVLSVNDIVDSGREPSSAGTFAATPLGRLVAGAWSAIAGEQIAAGKMDRMMPPLRSGWPVAALGLLLSELDRRPLRGQPARVVIGLDQFEEVIDRCEGNAAADLDRLFAFISLAAASRRIGFIYTCQTNRLQRLASDPWLGPLVDRRRQKEVPFLDEEEIKEVAQKAFEQAGIVLQPALIDELYERVVGFVARPAAASPAGGGRRNFEATILPLFSLTLLRIYEHCEQERKRLCDEAERKGPSAVGEEGVASGVKSNGGKGATFQLGADETLEVARTGFPVALLDIEGAIARLGDQALAELRESPGRNWSDETLDALLRRLVRIHDPQNTRYYLPVVTMPARGQGKRLVAALLKYRLLVREASDRVRLVHEAVITHWPPARTWAEREQKLLCDYELLEPYLERWAAQGRPRERVEQLLPGDVDAFVRVARGWFDVFRPRDGTKPTSADQTFCEFGFAAMEAKMMPDRMVHDEVSAITHFLMAVCYGRGDLVKRYLEASPAAAKEHRSKRQANAAHSAVYSDEVAMLDLMLQHGADPAVVDSSGWHPIHVATHFGNLAMVDRLVAAGVDPAARLKEGWSVLHVATSNGDLRMAMHLVERHRLDSNLTNEAGATPLSSACASGSAEIVRWLLGLSDADPSRKDRSGWSAFHWACHSGTAEMVAAMLDHPRVDPAAGAGKDNRLPLQLAIAAKAPEVIRALLRDRRIARTGSASKSLLELALDSGNPEVMSALLDDPQGLIDVNAKSEKNGSALFQACNSGKMDMIRLLVAAGARANGENGAHSPWLSAAGHGDAGILRILLSAPQIDVRETETRGRTALHLAAERGHVAVVRLLLLPEVVGLRDEDGHTALHLAVRANFLKTARVLWDHAPESLHEPDRLGRKAIHLAAAGPELALLEQLVSRCGVESPDAEGMGPLHHAVKAGKTDAVRWLLQHAARVNATDAAGWTPLHLAAQDGWLDVIDVLLENHADLLLIGFSPPHSALEAAAAAGQVEALKRMLRSLQAQGRKPPALENALVLALGQASLGTGALIATLLPEAVPGPGQARVREAFAQLVRSGPISPGLLEIARLLVDRAYIPPLQVPVPAEEPPVVVVPPAAPLRAPIHGYAWVPAAEELRARIIAQNPLIDGKHPIRGETTRVEICQLAWYRHHQLVRVHEPTWTVPNLRIYYLVGPGAGDLALYRLNGTSPPIHEVNAKDPIQLTPDNVISYLLFFCFFVRGEEGPFYLLESTDDPLLGPARASAATDPRIATAYQVVESLARPVTLDGVNPQGHFLCQATCFYSNAVFSVNFAIHPTGMVEMMDDEPIAADLPFRIQAPLA